MMTCTWKGCARPVEHPQTRDNGSVWARLCGPHDAAIKEAIADDDPGRLMGCWIAARGGALKAAAEDAPGITRAVRAMLRSIGVGGQA